MTNKLVQHFWFLLDHLNPLLIGVQSFLSVSVGTMSDFYLDIFSIMARSMNGALILLPVLQTGLLK